MARQTGVFYVTLFIILATSILFFAFDCPYLSRHISVSIPIVASLILAFVLCTLFRTSFIDPGIIPRANKQETDYFVKNGDISMQQPDPASVNNGNHRSTANAPRCKEVLINGQLVKLKFCFTCKIYRPPRASHCSLCDNCVERFDHHCPWVGNCVGKRNYRFFYMFLMSLAVLCIYILACSVTHIIMLMKTSSFMDAIKISPASSIVSVICFFSIWSILGLTGFHTYLTTSEQTTNEDIKGTFSSRKGRNVINPYSTGSPICNWVNVMCGPMPPSLIDLRGQLPENSTSVHPSLTYITPTSSISGVPLRSPLTVNAINGSILANSSKTHESSKKVPSKDSFTECRFESIYDPNKIRNQTEDANLGGAYYNRVMDWSESEVFKADAQHDERNVSIRMRGDEGIQKIGFDNLPVCNYGSMASTHQNLPTSAYFSTPTTTPIESLLFSTNNAKKINPTTSINDNTTFNNSSNISSSNHKHVVNTSGRIKNEPKNNVSVTRRQKLPPNQLFLLKKKKPLIKLTETKSTSINKHNNNVSFSHSSSSFDEPPIHATSEDKIPLCSRHNVNQTFQPVDRDKSQVVLGDEGVKRNKYDKLVTNSYANDNNFDQSSTNPESNIAHKSYHRSPDSKNYDSSLTTTYNRNKKFKKFDSVAMSESCEKLTSPPDQSRNIITCHKEKSYDPRFVIVAKSATEKSNYDHDHNEGHTDQKSNLRKREKENEPTNSNNITRQNLFEDHPFKKTLKFCIQSGIPTNLTDSYDFYDGVNTNDAENIVNIAGEPNVNLKNHGFEKNIDAAVDARKEDYGNGTNNIAINIPIKMNKESAKSREYNNMLIARDERDIKMVAKPVTLINHHSKHDNYIATSHTGNYNNVPYVKPTKRNHNFNMASGGIGQIMLPSLPMPIMKLSSV
ncbi:unnamed protein product [Gordionus sp. m RMFG-2023]